MVRRGWPSATQGRSDDEVPKSETELNQELVDKYNSEALPHLSKTVADLIADGGGLLLDPVVRPIISKIAP